MPDRLGNPFHTLTLHIYGLSGYTIGVALDYVGDLLARARLLGLPFELELECETIPAPAEDSSR